MCVLLILGFVLRVLWWGFDILHDREYSTYSRSDIKRRRATCVHVSKGLHMCRNPEPCTINPISSVEEQPLTLVVSWLQVIIDAQQTYREGVMKLEGVEPALEECAALLKRARAEGRPR